MSFTISIERDVDVPMRDGVVLKADIYRPAGDGPFPVVVARTPYGRSDPTETAFIDPWSAAKHGLIAVVQDVRGRFDSEGVWIPVVHETEDGVDTIAWAAQLPRSNGRVGTWGFSYLGTVQWRVAEAGAPALVAIAPRFTWRDADDGFLRRGGALEHGMVVGWSLYMGIGIAVRRAVDEETMTRQILGIVADMDRAHDTNRELPSGAHPIYARHGLPTLTSLGPEEPVAAAAAVSADGSSVPSLNIAGWWDCFQQGTIDNYLAAGTNGSRLLIGPWSHESTTARQGDVNYGLAADGSAVELGQSLTDLTYDWLRRHLDASDNAPVDDGWQAHAPVRIFTMGRNEWQHLAQWPPSGVVDTAFMLSGDERLLPAGDPAEESFAEFVYDPLDPVPTTGGAHLLADRLPGPLDQRDIESRGDVLVFTSGILDTDLEVTGRIRARLTAATDGPTTDWVVRLCDVDKAGVSHNVADGITRVISTPGQPQEVEIDLWSTSMVFKVGHRLRVQVTSSCFPRWDRNLNSKIPAAAATTPRIARQRVYLGSGERSVLILPVVPKP